MSAENSGEACLSEQVTRGQGSAVVLDLSPERHHRGQTSENLGSLLFWKFSLPRPADAFGAAGDFCSRPRDASVLSGFARCGTAVTSSRKAAFFHGCAANTLPTPGTSPFVNCPGQAQSVAMTEKSSAVSSVWCCIVCWRDVKQCQQRCLSWRMS